MSEDLDLSIIIPVKNEAGAVPVLAGEIEQAMTGLDIRWECLWIDDGSTDDTLARIEELHRRESRHHFVSMTQNCGQSAALLAGFDYARGRIIATLDGDLQSDPGDLPPLLPLLRRGEVDMVCGIRVLRHDSRIRRISSRLGNRLRNVITGERMTDEGCAVRVFYRECALGLPRFRGLHRFLPGLAELRGFRWIEVPVRHRPRSLGRSKYGIGNRLWPVLVDTLGVSWLRRRVALPVVKRSSLPETRSE